VQEPLNIRYNRYQNGRNASSSVASVDLLLHGKNGFVEVFKNLVRLRNIYNFIGLKIIM